MITIIIAGISAKKTFESKAEIKIISLAKFNEGGAAKLKERKINHQKDTEGEKVRRPLIKNILREWDSLYV